MITHDSTTTGLNALINALQDSGVEKITAVAGFPITDLMNQILKDEKEIASWITNEKTALEIVLGASVSGKRGAVIVKHVGMNILSDPLITSVTHTIGAGIVIIVGDDPGVIASQNEQDSRWYGSIAEACVFDPSTPANAYKSVMRAFDLSEELSSPVIIRITDRLLKSIGKIERQKFNNKRKFFDKSIWELKIREKHQRFHLNVYPLLIKESENNLFQNSLTSFKVEYAFVLPIRSFVPNKLSKIKDFFIRSFVPNKLSKIKDFFIRSFVPNELLKKQKIHKNDLGIISSGFTSTLVNKCVYGTNIAHISLNIVYPLPFNMLRNFINAHKKILIIEESESVIESHLCIHKNIFGKKTGHVPYGLIELKDIEYAINNINKVPSIQYKKRDIAKRKNICEDCHFMILYQILRDIDVLVAGDLGCSVRATHAPLNAIDTGYALGSAISVACGFSKKGIAVIGDFAFSHSGIISLINAVQIKANLLVIILQNDIAAMTGGQNSYDLTKVVQAITNNVSIFNIENSLPSNEVKEKLSNLIAHNMDQVGISVICIKAKCEKHKRD